jgi:two-component system chemotaxis response regulator CheY
MTDPDTPTRPAGAADAPAGSDEPAVVHGCDVLIADDAGPSRELLAGILRSIAGPLAIREARNGGDAVTLWRDLRPRITLLDIDMPGLDGLSALERIRSVDSKAFVAMVSGSSDIDKVKRALAHGAAGYVIKPYKPQRIVELLQRYTERSGHALMR